jgi:hypothetical protein
MSSFPKSHERIFLYGSKILGTVLCESEPEFADGKDLLKG